MTSTTRAQLGWTCQPHYVEPMTSYVKHNKEGEPERVARIELRQYDEQPTGGHAVGDHVQNTPKL